MALVFGLGMFGIAVSASGQDKFVPSISQFEKTAPSRFVLQVAGRTENISIHYVPEDNAGPLPFLNPLKIIFSGWLISDRRHTQVIPAEFHHRLRFSGEQKHSFCESLPMPILGLFWHLSRVFNHAPLLRSSDNHGGSGATIFSFHAERSREFFVLLNNHHHPSPLGVYDSLSVQESSLGSVLGLKRLPADYQSGKSSNDDEPPVRISPPYLGPFEGCVPGWRVIAALSFVATGLGLGLFSIRYMKGWLLLFSWLLVWVGILIGLTGHYPCAYQTNGEDRQYFQHNAGNCTTKTLDRI